MELYRTEFGSPDAPALLVLHGGPGASHEYMLPQMLALVSDYRLIFYDQRGGGRSRSDDRTPVTWESHVHDLATLVHELARDEPLTLVGYSWGGLLALLYAITAANGTVPAPSRMVLITPAPATFVLREQFSEELARRQRAPWIAEERAALAASGLRERDPDSYSKRLFELSVSGYFTNPARAKELTPFRLVGRVQQSVWDSLGHYDITAELPLIAAPTLVIHGAHDAIPLASSELIASALPHGELVVLDASAHVPYVEGEQEFFTAVREFLQRTASQS